MSSVGWRLSWVILATSSRLSIKSLPPGSPPSHIAGRRAFQARLADGSGGLSQAAFERERMTCWSPRSALQVLSRLMREIKLARVIFCWRGARSGTHPTLEFNAPHVPAHWRLPSGAHKDLPAVSACRAGLGDPIRRNHMQGATAMARPQLRCSKGGSAALTMVRSHPPLAAEARGR